MVVDFLMPPLYFPHEPFQTAGLSKKDSAARHIFMFASADRLRSPILFRTPTLPHLFHAYYFLNAADFAAL
jgi:hypothetical protein